MALLCFTGKNNFSYNYLIISKHVLIHTFLILRGDLTRERKNKIKVLKDTNVSITGLAIRSTGKQNHLFVATPNSVFLYNVTIKDKEFKSPLDTMGCARKCSVLAESMQDSHFMIGRNDVITLIEFHYAICQYHFTTNNKFLL